MTHFWLYKQNLAKTPVKISLQHGDYCNFTKTYLFRFMFQVPSLLDEAQVTNDCFNEKSNWIPIL